MVHRNVETLLLTAQGLLGPTPIAASPISSWKEWGRWADQRPPYLEGGLRDEDEPEQGDEEEAAEEDEEGGDLGRARRSGEKTVLYQYSEERFSGRERHHLDDVVGDHVDPADEALIGDEGHEGRLPLEDEVDDEASEDPVEAGPEHVGRVQHAQAEVERAVGEERRLEEGAKASSPARDASPFGTSMIHEYGANRGVGAHTLWISLRKIDSSLVVSTVEPKRQRLSFCAGRAGEGRARHGNDSTKKITWMIMRLLVTAKAYTLPPQPHMRVSTKPGRTRFDCHKQQPQLSQRNENGHMR